MNRRELSMLNSRATVQCADGESQLQTVPKSVSHKTFHIRYTTAPGRPKRICQCLQS